MTAAPPRPSAGLPLQRGSAGTPAESSLDPLEISEQCHTPTGVDHQFFGSDEFACRPPQLEETLFRHSGWMSTRSRVYDALIRIHTPYRRLEQFACCGSNLWAERRDDGQDLRLRADCCHDRWCIPCARVRASTICANLSRWREGRELKFWTFTLRHSRTSLSSQIDRLKRSFKELRRRDCWKEKISGGLYVMEVKTGEDGLWHPHLHVLVEGKYISQDTVARAWHEITGDSWMVFVTAVRDREGVESYLTKYLTKPMSHDIYLDPERLDEALVSLKSVHQVATFGSWRKLKLLSPPDDAHDWRPIGSVLSLYQKAAEGEPDAVRWREALERKYPTLSLFARPPPDPSSEEVP